MFSDLFYPPKDCALVFYCSIRKYHKFRDLKSILFFFKISKFYKLEIWHTRSGFSAQVKIKVLVRHCLNLEALGNHLFFKLI